MFKNLLLMVFFIIILLSCVCCASMDAVAYKDRGNEYLKKNEFDKALIEYKKSLKIDPNYPNAIYNIGIVYVYQKKYDEALIQYNKAIEICRDDNLKSIMYESRSRLYYSIYRNYFLALQDCEKSINLNPNNNSAKSFFQNMNLKRFNNVNDAINYFVKEYPKQSSAGESLWVNYIGYHIVEGNNNRVIIYIEKPNPRDEVNNSQNNTVRPLRELSFIPPHISIPLIINENLNGIYFKFPDRKGDAVEINKEFYNAFIKYLKEKVPTSAQKDDIKNRASQQEMGRIQDENARMYKRIFEVLEREVPGQNFMEWVINTRDQFVNEINRNNQSDNVINTYYHNVFTSDGRLISRDLLTKITASALGSDRYGRIINISTQYLSRDGYYDINTYTATAQIIGILIIKELCRQKINS
jgi:tetratricopeptide (TPR) repeat protein